MRNTYRFKALTFDPTVIQLLKRIYSHEKYALVIRKRCKVILLKTANVPYRVHKSLFNIHIYNNPL